MLFRRRQVWLPTLWGVLLLLALAAALVFTLGRFAYALLAPESPVPGARVLVVEGWLGPSEIRQAIAAARAGGYATVLTSGGPIEAPYDVGSHGTYAQRAAAWLRAGGLTELPVIAVPTPDTARDRSYLSAVTLRTWFEQHDPTLTAYDLYSAGVHARRSWLVHRMAFGDRVQVGIRAARAGTHDGNRWWTSSEATKAVLGESIGLAWTKCCFWPGPPDAVPAAPAR